MKDNCVEPDRFRRLPQKAAERESRRLKSTSVTSSTTWSCVGTCPTYTQRRSLHSTRQECHISLKVAVIHHSTRREKIAAVNEKCGPRIDGMSFTSWAGIASHRLSPWSTLTVNQKTILYVLVPRITLSNHEVVKRLMYFLYIAKLNIRTFAESIVGLLRPIFCLQRSSYQGAIPGISGPAVILTVLSIMADVYCLHIILPTPVHMRFCLSFLS